MKTKTIYRVNKYYWGSARYELQRVTVMDQKELDIKSVAEFVDNHEAELFQRYLETQQKNKKET